MRVSSAISLFVLMTTPCSALSGGVFCKGKISFIARTEPAGSLAFKVMGSNEAGSVIEVAGIAHKHAAGWRYQIKSVSSPEDRCTLDINELDGGYAVRSIEGARCQSSGGNGAYLLIRSVAFSEKTIIKNISPPDGPPDNYPSVNCSKKKFD